MSTHIYILNGPNLNLLGSREPEIYGHASLLDIEKACSEKAKRLGLIMTFRQTNSEGTLVDWIQEAGRQQAAIILNAAAYTHTSIAIQDALKTIQSPKIELHLSNPHRRENFRHKSFISTAVDGVVAGFGADGYLLALDAVHRLIEKTPIV
ncbi:MAG: type II 3-dehydroquinate dehydratase [bacterium]